MSLIGWTCSGNIFSQRGPKTRMGVLRTPGLSPCVAAKCLLPLHSWCLLPCPTLGVSQMWALTQQPVFRAPAGRPCALSHLTFTMPPGGGSQQLQGRGEKESALGSTGKRRISRSSPCCSLLPPPPPPALCREAPAEPSPLYVSPSWWRSPLWAVHVPRGP